MLFKEPARLIVFILLALLMMKAGAWQVVRVLVQTGHGDFDLFGVEARIVIESIPRYTFSVLGVAYLVLTGLATIALALRRRITLVFLLGASLVHLVIWTRVASNPFQPGWPGVLFMTEEVLAIVLLVDMARRDRLY